ncbi:MAG: AAA family ATPase [Anaerolineales bacterium]|jgi:MinD-like ATPase involved in chromosome partitioning or flagellar assembly
MQILLLGAGSVTSRLNLLLTEHGHSVAAQMAAFTPQHLGLFDFQGMVVVSPEVSVSTESLVQAAEHGKVLFVVAGTGDGLAAWANGVGVPAFAYPISEVEKDRLLGEIRRAEAGNLAVDEQYRRAVLGSDLAARLGSGMAIRKIAVTSPKGGTGKTTVAVNLAVAFALSGVTTYLVDSDANAGAIQYHLRLEQAHTTMIGLLRRELSKPQVNTTMSEIASGAAYLEAFTPLDNLATLRVLPGLVMDDLSDEALQDEERITAVLSGLYEAGVSSGGVVIMDVGINPAHVVHRAALRLAEGIAIVIKPEIPDLAETRRWIARMLGSLSGVVGREAAYEFVGGRVKLCYNQVLGKDFKAAHRTLQAALYEDEIELSLTPNGVIPVVDAGIAAHGVNSDRREDILVWRYKREKLEELKPYTEALLGFAAHFVPAVREGASRAGLLAHPDGRSKRGLFQLFRKLWPY